jgi:hypothetical protein
MRTTVPIMNRCFGCYVELLSQILGHITLKNALIVGLFHLNKLALRPSDDMSTFEQAGVSHTRAQTPFESCFNS